MKQRSNIDIDQSWYEKPDGIQERLSCGGVVCRVNDGQVLILLTLKKMVVVSFYQGGREIGELDLETARRVREEAGISDLTLITDLGNLQRLSLQSRSGLILIFCFIRDKSMELQDHE